jgi:hypothetical protein
MVRDRLVLIAQARRYGRLELKDRKVVVEGRFPSALLEELRARKEDVRKALLVASAVSEIRPHLSPTLRDLPDEKLLALVSWHVIATWERRIHKVATGVEGSDA